MDIGMDRSGSDVGVATIGTLFQHIVNDMKNSSPLWEDFIAKATKLHACLRAAIQALAAYLDAFQKIADAATNSRGATKEIGTALTRVCLRHKAVESRMKTFTSAIMDCLIVPLQEKLEDWRKQVTVIDKDHAKEYKRCRAELKKRSSDTLRLQKKAKKGAADNLHVLVESSMQDVTLRRCELEDVERKSLRAIMVEERSRYCTFVSLLQPVVHEECEVMSELGHLQEAMQLIAAVTKDPTQLPQASEELILESKANIGLYPDSPGGSNSQGGCSNSLGSRKSSVCSISSINSSSSGSPGHHHHQFQRSLSQYSPAIRLKPGESSDSGFCSSPALTSQASTLASQSHAVSTWPPHTQDATSTVDRPHTISSAYEKGHQRPALTVYTFQSPEPIVETQKSPANIACRPPLPVRCSSLERPLSTTSVKNANPNVPRQCPSPIPAHITKEHPQLQPTYVNMTELASMAASKTTNNGINNNNGGGTSATVTANQQHVQQQQNAHVYQQQQQLQQPNSPVLSSASSLISPDSTNATNPISSPDASACSTQTPQNTPQTGSPGTPNYSGGGAINQGYRSTTPSSATGGICGGPGGGSSGHFDPASTPCESNNDTSSNHTITIDDPIDEHSNTSTCAASATTISTTTNITTTTATTSTTSSITNKPSSTHCPGTTTATDSSISSSSASAAGAGTATATNVTTSLSSSTCSSSSATSKAIDKDLLKRTGSVLEKTSMFEQQINNNQLHLQQPQPQSQPPPPQQQLSVPTVTAVRNDPNALYGGRRTNEEIYKSAGQLLLDRDADCIDKQTIEELNNLIGELDLFQKEHESGAFRETTHHQHRHRSHGIGDPIANGVNNNYGDDTIQSGGLGGSDGSTPPPPHPAPTSRLPSSISSSNSNLDEYLSNHLSSLDDETNGGSMTNLAAQYSNYGGKTTVDGTERADYGTPPYQSHHHHRGALGVSSGSTQALDGLGTGFENPSFMMETYYSQNRSEVVVLRCKDTSRNSLNTAPDDLLTGSGLMQLNGGSDSANPPHQRLSSFRVTSRPASPASMSSFFGVTSRSPTPSLSLPATAHCSPQRQLNGSNEIIPSAHDSRSGAIAATPYDDRINRNKPAITPRPASLSGPTRVTRRASVNTVKPPPPVRRSSSVTPSPSVGTNSTNLAQQSVAYTSSESLPPPPAYLLDSTAGSSPSISGNVAGTVKALNEIRHTPASPGVLRRAQQSNAPSSNQGSPTQYTTTNLYATLPTKHDHSTVSAASASSQHHHHPSTPPPNSFHASDSNKSLSNRSPKTNLHQPGGGIYAQPKQITNMSSFRISSPNKQGPTKPNSSFLAQLNAKIAPPSKAPPSQPTPSAGGVYQQQQLQQPSSNYVYTTAPSGNELIYQRSTPVDPRMSYNNNQQHQQQQQQYYHSQQQQAPVQPPPREGKNSIYSASSQSSSHQQQQQHYQQQQYYQNQYQQHPQQQQLQYQQPPTSQQYYYHQQQAPPRQHHTPQHTTTAPTLQYVPPSGGYAAQNIYVSTNPFASSVQTVATAGGGSASSSSSYSPSSFGKGHRNGGDDGAAGGSATSTPVRTNHHMRNSAGNNNGSAGGSGSVAPGGSVTTHNVLAKTSAGFLENLNARLAEQRLSGKAFAVRNLINSKALPDPRVCHESLMDQIKRGATLKRNRTINDRSAPKIH
ncbi:serine-rich adhesin for platelets [Anopheles bellator]|uniref:serine-rich adhesin for platelets n=1 Tax=Anopheles bellator TaxID=139047 RepID=UPI00264A33A5|nr:serine-rich adhesin for platelets [Anopheles bellator]